MFTPPTKPDPQRAAEAAARFFGLELDEVTLSAAGAAFRRVARECHPDAGGGDPERLALAQRHRDALVDYLDSLPDPDCSRCHGSGYYRVGIITKPCTLCLDQ